MAYYVFQSVRDNNWYWHLKASNGQIVAVAGEGYVSKQGCLHGISLVKSSYNAPVYDA